MRNLEHDFTPLEFNDVVGLTHYTDDRDSRGRALPRLALKKGVVRWCRDNLVQVPMLKAYRATIINKQRKPGKVWLRFEDENDRMLFQLRFAHHFMPAAIHFIPFSDELND